MATPGYDNCHSMALSALCIGFALGVAAAANDQTPTQGQASTRNFPLVMTPEEAKSAIDPLLQALDACRDGDTAWHIRYCMGVIHFRAGMMAEADAGFEQIAGASEAPQLIQACGLNMAGQIARLQGDNLRAMEAFGRLADLAEKRLAAKSGDASDVVLCRLWCAALIARAEICELQKDHAAAANEYKRFLQAPLDLKNDESLKSRVPLVMDRLSQLRLQEHETDEYLSLAAALVTQFPTYSRAPLIELESLCVRALRDAQPRPEYSQGAVPAPVYLIEHLRQTCRGPGGPKPAIAPEERGRSLSGPGGGDDCNAVLDAVDQLCRRHQGTPADALLNYHYAWMLEAAGERDKAIEAIARISCRGLSVREEHAPGAPQAPRENGRDTSDEAVVPQTCRPHQDVLYEYATIQHALMLAERGDYAGALQLLANLSADGDKTPHISQLAESVTKSIQTLKREVATNETQQHE